MSKYKVLYSFIDAWVSGKLTKPGWCICEVREYADGKVEVFRFTPRYLDDEDRVYKPILTSYVVLNDALLARK